VSQERAKLRLISREQVRRILWGCSIATVRRLERVGKLTPIRAPLGKTGRIRVRFDPEKVHVFDEGSGEFGNGSPRE
jgi:hypothetical protein